MKRLLFSVLLALAGRTNAIAAPVAAPIAVTDCRFYVFTADAFFGEMTAGRTRTLWVTFTNTEDAPIMAVTFDAIKSGEHLVVTDKGHFSRGATITHQLLGYSTDTSGGLDNAATGPGLDSCKVAAVQFADGMTRTY
jgi:hypothetical protein